MPAASQPHSPTPEDIMAYLDGETPVESRPSMESHLAVCKECEMVAASFRDLSNSTAAWAVEPAPATLEVPAGAPAPGAATRILRFAARRPSVVFLGGLAAAAALIVVVSLKPPRTKPFDGTASLADAVASMPPDVAQMPAAAGRPMNDRTTLATQPYMLSAPASEPPAREAVRRPTVIRTASLQIVARNFDGVRASVEGIVAEFNGFIDQMTVTGDTSAARALRGTLRVPSERLSEALAQLRRVGHVVEDTQGSEDVTDQIVDLDARMLSARATEQRLTEILRTRTGKLSDVLEVERELARVRLDIERLDAEKTNIGRRVSYATIRLTVSEERKAGLDPGPLSFATRIRIAAADGLEAAFESVAITTLMLLRSGPTVVTWSVLVGLLWVLARRFRRTPAPGTKS